MASCAETPVKKTVSKTEKARMYVEVANGALLEGDPTGALQSLASAENEEPNLPEIHHSRALAYYAKKDLKEALSSARKSVMLKPDYCEANNTFGKLLMDAGNYDEAIKPLMVAANDPLCREAFKAQTNLGIIYYKKLEYEKAMGYLEKAITAAPNVACIAYYYRGHVHIKQSKLSAAIDDYDMATRRFCANFGEAHLALGIAYVQAREYGKARKKFIEIERLYPKTNLANEAINHLRYLP